jgi:hypothetical protein
MELQFNNQTIQRHFDKLSYIYLLLIYLFIQELAPGAEKRMKIG